MISSPVKQLLQDETKKQALIGHLPREVGVMYQMALAEIEKGDALASAVVQYLTAVATAGEALRAAMIRYNREILK